MHSLAGVSVFLANYLSALGIAGCAVIFLSALYAGLSYVGKNRERYSVLNHYVSELGEVGVSKNAQSLNGGLILGGLILIPFIIELGLILGNIWAKLGILAGLWAAISCVCVGLFPMNNLTPHLRAAISYFRAGLVTILLFSIGILVQPAGMEVVSKYTNIIGLFSLVSYASFLTLLGKEEAGSETSNQLDPEVKPERPRVWLSPLLEWVVFFSTILWFFNVAILVRA